jgi:hypothetical protein
MGPVLKKYGIPPGNSWRKALVGGTLGLGLGAGIGGAASSNTLEGAIGGELGGAAGLLGGASIGMDSLLKNAKASPKSALLKYLLQLSGGTALGATGGAALASATGITPKVKKMLGVDDSEYGYGNKVDIAAMTPEERMKMFGREVYPA